MMKSKILKSVYVVALVSVLVLAGAILLTPMRSVRAQSQEVPSQSESQAGRLEGTWRVQVAIRNCQTGEALRSFPALLTFAQGGTLTETTTGFAPAQRTPGHGFWRRTGGHTYRAVSEAFLFNPAGAWTGTQKLTQTIEIEGNSDEFNSNATIEIFDVNGSLTTTGCATAIGRRLE